MEGVMPNKVYLGDSVYVDNDGYYLILTTENGDSPSNVIYLERPVWRSLCEYVERMKQPQGADPKVQETA
jgi:hypothetical protein